ncbi:hypothetical protein [Candidatus Venteria ishoeyi]|nr:hypothetical protein [Candidatus Venteria ishoeyi]
MENGNFAVKSGQIICNLSIREPISSSEGMLSQVVQTIKVEANIRYAISDILSQLTQKPNWIRLPEPQAMLVKLLMNGQELPISLNVQPSYMLKNKTLCQLQVSSFRLNATNLKSTYLPPWLASGLQNYINKDPKIRRIAIEQARKVLPQIKSQFHCR